MNPILELKTEVKAVINGVEVETRIIGRRVDTVLENEQERVYIDYTIEADRTNLYKADSLTPVEIKSKKAVND